MAVKSQGRVHDVFTGLITGLASQAAAQAEAARGRGDRPWNRPEKGWGGDPLDVPGITGAFDRSELGTNYGQIVGSGATPGTLGDVVSVKVQGDYVAVAERAFRARHCTPVRLLALAAARRGGHGQDAGIFAGGVLKYAQDALTAGQVA